ncbi:MAG: DUF5686 family protein, partial [Bacteroidota bacterium]
MHNYKINQPKDPKFYQEEMLEIKEDAEGKDSLFWTEHRRSPLDKSEQLGYALVDSLTSRGVLDLYIELGRFIARGTKRFEYFELGPYFQLLGFNQAEGLRARLGIYTTKAFSKKLYLGGHAAYGFRDKQWKYQVEGRYRIVRKPRLEIGFQKTYEVEQVGVKDFLNNGAGLLQSLLRRVPLTQLNYYHEHRVDIWSDIAKGLSGNFFLRSKVFQPTATFPFGFRHEGGVRRRYNFTEAGMDLRVSFSEQYITSAKGDRVYIGTKYPIFNLQYSTGLSGFLDGELQYHKVDIGMRNFLRMGRYGKLNYDVHVGQIFGTLPFPSLHVFAGNQTWGYDKVGFNMMNYYEFVADRYATAAVEHHFEGLIWNMLPLLRKLKWKEVLTARLAWGTLNDDNRRLNNLTFA